MRSLRPLLLIVLAACAPAPSSEEPRPPAAATIPLDHPDPARREEAVASASARGLSLEEAKGDRSLDRSSEDTASLRAGIQNALGEPSPERMIHHAYHVLRLGCLARDARTVAGALSGQGFRLIEIYEPNSTIKFTRYLAQPGAYTNAAGDRHDLFCWTQAVRRPDSSWLTREVYVGLHVRFDAPFKTVAVADRYPRGSVLGRFLELADLQKVAQVYPLLEEIEFTYGRIRVKGPEPSPAGFHVNAGFVMDGKAGGRSVYYTAESGLDPLESRGGRLEWNGFVPSETVGPLLPRGSGIWGAGGLKPRSDD
jgi:hypothetical protein